MSNLIPPTARQALKKEYRVRVISVWLCLISLGLLITSILLLPSYVLINSQKKAYASAFAEASRYSNEFTTISDTLTFIDSLTRTLLVDETTTKTSRYITIIRSALPAATQLASFNYDASQQIISISGVAPDRESLALLKQQLEATNEFVRVELPLSNLASNENITFSVNLVLTSQTP